MVPLCCGVVVGDMGTDRQVRGVSRAQSQSRAAAPDRCVRSRIGPLGPSLLGSSKGFGLTEEECHWFG